MKHHSDYDDNRASSEQGDDLEFDPADIHRRMEIKRKLDENEGELDEGFNWDDFDKE